MKCLLERKIVIIETPVPKIVYRSLSILYGLDMVHIKKLTKYKFCILSGIAPANLKTKVIKTDTMKKRSVSTDD
jgi:hypothetical protein